MESHLLGPREVSLETISREFPYGLRFAYGDRALEASLEKRGILSPLLVIPKSEGGEGKGEGVRGVLLAGHKRFFWARKKGLHAVPVYWISEPLTEKEKFLLALFTNWNQTFPELDRTVTLAKAEKEFHFSKQEVVEEVMPALGLEPSLRILEAYREVDRLIPEIHQLIHQKRLPFRGASLLARFTKEEQGLWVREVFENLYLSSNQLRGVTEWLGDLQKSRQVSLAECLKEISLRTPFEHPSMDPRQKGEKFFEAVRRLRLPRLAQEEEAFRRLQSQGASPQEVLWERPEAFEGRGLSLRVRLKNRESLRRIIDFLRARQTELESFLP